jgi:hypothetical protein
MTLTDMANSSTNEPVIRQFERCRGVGCTQHIHPPTYTLRYIGTYTRMHMLFTLSMDCQITCHDEAPASLRGIIVALYRC